MDFMDPGRDEEVVLDITPLIDMVFQMLIFFLLTTTFAINVKEGGIEVDVPRAKSTQIPAMASQMVVAVLKDGRLVVGGESVSEEVLDDKLRQAQQQNPRTMVVVQADRMANHWRVVRVLDLAVEAGLKPAIATLEEQ